MEDDTPGVTSTDSPPAPQSQLTADDLRTAESIPPADRPMQNIVGEFNRKYGALNQKIDGILNWINTQAASPPVQSQAAPAGQGQVSNEELWRLAQQGDRQAFEAYQARIADQQLSQRLQAASWEQTVDRQMEAILRTYPVLQDANHPLTQHANAALTLLLRRGYPNNRATMLEAAKTAIADRPDIVSELHQQGAVASGAARRTAAQAAQAGATGVSHRSDQARTTAPKALTQEQKDLAARMNVKDPEGARKRFLQRQQDGRSHFGAVSAFINEEEL
jgi:hypothetical protein